MTRRGEVWRALLAGAAILLAAAGCKPDRAAWETTAAPGLTDSAGAPGQDDFYRAVRDGRLDDVQRLLAADPQLACARYSCGYTPLHLVCHSSSSGDIPSRVAIARALLENGADPFAEADYPPGPRPIELARLWDNMDHIWGKGRDSGPIVELLSKAMAPTIDKERRGLQDIQSAFADAVLAVDADAIRAVTVEHPRYRKGMWIGWAAALRSEYSEEPERLRTLVDCDWRRGWACIYVAAPSKADYGFRQFHLMRLPDGQYRIVETTTTPDRGCGPAAWAAGRSRFWSSERDALLAGVTRSLE